MVWFHCWQFPIVRSSSHSTVYRKRCWQWGGVWCGGVGWGLVWWGGMRCDGMRWDGVGCGGVE